MRRGTRIGFLILMLGISPTAIAMFAGHWVPVPTERLVRNVSAYVKAHPDDDRGHYTLGRIHSLAFVRNEASIFVSTTDRQTDTQAPLPGFAPNASILQPSQHHESALSGAPKTHLIESLREYRKATRHGPDPLYMMGFGWMLEQGALYAPQIGKIPELPDLKPTAEAWRVEALAAYRDAYAASHDQDAKEEHRSLNNPDDSISVEAGEGILRLRKLLPLSNAKKNELEEIRAHLAMMKKKQGWITPIIFSMNPNARLADLLSPDQTVRFDLAVNLRRDRWPWVRPETGILVWDPERKGRITSGSQLFGSRTWEMFWRNGYEPLAALDDDKDGFLTGPELKGIAVWFDRNSNGRSDRGEVIPVESLGIKRIAVQPDSMSEGVPASKLGIQYSDGTTVTTFDWTPKSIVDLPTSTPTISTWD